MGNILPIASVERFEGDPESSLYSDPRLAVDEQDTLEGEPGWYNSTYFDEIYHARTGYEHLHHLQTYETTHPPLGKVFISWAIAIFGMTPFGWRFAGALAGVLMLPGMYLLGKLFAKRWWGGMAAALLMAFDLMHFTQTRIATIDSFAVLFIIWMMYFMFVWFFQDFFGKPFWKTLVPLSLSKGLEFDAVLVMDCDEAHYSQPGDRRLLYVACTRALHRLALFSERDYSPLIRREVSHA